MNASRSPKAMAKTLRTELSARNLDLSHSDCLEIVARQLGFADWNTAAAGLQPQPFPPLQLPLGWVVGGNDAYDYQIGIDPDRPGCPATIKSLHEKGPQTGFATLMQSVDAGPFRDQRIKLEADLSCAHVSGAATIWLRVDDAAGRNIRFDNMETRSIDGVISGTVDWVTRAIVLDVPEEAETLNYGFYMRGRGQCWARSFDIDQVDQSIPVTAQRRGALPQPMNLNFAQKSVMGDLR